MQKLYTAGDMAKIGCDGCKGCSSCCEGMDDTVVLNPYDVYELTKNLNCSFEQMLNEKVELHIEEGRCEIHPFRPGLCRLFPLGRNYESEGEMWESTDIR